MNSNCNCVMSVLRKQCPRQPFNCNRCQAKLKNAGKVWRAKAPSFSGYYIESGGFTVDLEYDNSAQLNSFVNNTDYGSTGLVYQGEKSAFPDRPDDYEAGEEGYKPCFSGTSEELSDNITTSDAAITDFNTAFAESSQLTWEDDGPQHSAFAINVAHYYGEGWRVILTVRVLGYHDTLRTQLGRAGDVVFMFGGVYKSSMNKCFLNENERFSRSSVGFNIAHDTNYDDSYLTWLAEDNTDPAFDPSYGNDIAAVAHLQLPDYIDMRHVDIND